MELEARTLAEVLDVFQNYPYNRNVRPALWTGYGKDATACYLLLRAVGVEFNCLFIDNQGDIPQHYCVIPDFYSWVARQGWGYDTIVYRTEKRHIDYVKWYRDHGRNNNYQKKKGGLVDFFDLGNLNVPLSWDINNRFSFAYSDQDDVLYIEGDRAGEYIYRFEHFRKYGKCYRDESGSPTFYKFQPVADWSDVDIWALLIKHDVPVSPVYSFHQVHQHGGKQRFPRTLWYASADLMNEIYWKWLRTYAPACAQEMLDFFPEIGMRFNV